MSKIPKLRFKEFSDEWEIEKFGELTKFQQGVQVDVELQLKEPQNGYVKFIRIENYTQNSQDLRYIPKDLAKNKTITEKEIAVVRYGATAGFIGRGFNGVLANNLFKLVPNSSILDTEYLFQYLKSHKVFSFFQSEMAGGAMPALSFGIVQVLKIPYPSILEQKKIASFLSVVDAKIDQLSRKKELLKQYKKGVMQKIFSQELRFKADDGSEFPEWEEKRLGEIGDFKSGTGFPENEQGGEFGVPFFKVSDMNLADNTFYMKSANHYVTDEQISKLKFKVIKEASIIFAKVGAAIFLERKRIAVNFLIDNNMMAFTPKANLLFMKYIFDTIKLSKYAQVGALPSYNASDLKIIKVKIPLSKDEQDKIANFLSVIDTKIDFVAQQLDEVKNFKKGLLQQMFV